MPPTHRTKQRVSPTEDARQRTVDTRLRRVDQPNVVPYNPHLLPYECHINVEVVMVVIKCMLKYIFKGNDAINVLDQPSTQIELPRWEPQ